MDKMTSEKENSNQLKEKPATDAITFALSGLKIMPTKRLKVIFC